MAILTDDMKRIIAEVRLCYAATVTPEGKPNLSPKGSIVVLGDSELGFADLGSPRTLENVRHNPAIEINVVDPFVRKGYRFKGRAEIVSDPAACAVIGKLLGPAYPFTQVVKIHVDQALPVASPIYHLSKVTESEIKQVWLETYGYRSVR